MWVLWVNWILFYSLEIQSLPLSTPNDREQICLWTIFILMFCGSDQKPLETPNYSQIMMDSESFLVVGICSSHKMMQNKLVWFLFILLTVLLLTRDFEKGRFVPCLKTHTHTQWLRDAVHKGHLLAELRSWKGHIPCAIWKRDSVIPTCQYNFSMSFSSEC